MKNRLFYPLLFLGILLLLSGCSNRKNEPLVPDDYGGWKETTDIELNYPIPGHENNYRKIFINDIGLKRTGPPHDYPDGTIIIKEIYEGFDYNAGRKPMMLTVMIKDRENPLARGGWLWIVKDSATKEENILTQEFCITCHGNANEEHPYGDLNMNNEFRDYVFFPVE